MLRFMSSDTTIGQLIPRIIPAAYQYLCKLLPTPVDLFMQRLHWPFLQKTQHFNERSALNCHCANHRYSGVNPISLRCFMMFRTSSLRRVGLFDERFFMYPEDIDITRRMHAEFRTVFYPGATAVHDHARESYKSARALWVHAYNTMKYFNKWGWVHDPERDRFNRETRERLGRFCEDQPKSARLVDQSDRYS